MATTSKIASRQTALWSMLGLSLIFNLPLIAFFALTAANLASLPRFIASVAIVFQSISLVLLCTLIWRKCTTGTPTTVADSSSLRKRRCLDVLANGIALLIGTGLGLGTIGLINGNLSQLHAVAGLDPTAIMIVDVTLVALVLIVESTALVLLVMDSRESSLIVMLPSLDMMDARSHWSDGEGVELPHTTSYAVNNQIPDPPKTADSSTVSFRSSLTASTQPSSSKHQSGASLPTSSSQSSQFDTWDTSSVPPPLRDTVHCRVQRVLPPIPGSRPASPANALEGPFLPDSPRMHESIAPLPSPSSASEQFYSPPETPMPLSSRPALKTSISLDSIPVARLAINLDVETHASRSPFSPSAAFDAADLLASARNYSQTSLAESVSHLASRRVTTIPSEENIHPLFRASSATPPPGASINTVVTAASIEDALGKRRTASAEALRNRAASDRSLGHNSSNIAVVRNTTRSRASSKHIVEASSPLTTAEFWVVAEKEEPPSPERRPAPAGPSRSRNPPQRASAASSRMDIPDYVVAATT